MGWKIDSKLKIIRTIRKDLFGSFILGKTTLRREPTVIEIRRDL